MLNADHSIDDIPTAYLLIVIIDIAFNVRVIQVSRHVQRSALDDATKRVN